jgi:hypothetical protein
MFPVRARFGGIIAEASRMFFKVRRNRRMQYRKAHMSAINKSKITG